MQKYLRDVGRGKKGARDLSLAEAKEAAAHIFDGKATDAQIGAFLLAERMKGESIEELQGFVEECRSRSKRLQHKKEGVLDCSGPYDGRAKSFAATLPASLILAAQGVPVVLHGSDSLPPKYGVTLFDILKRLGFCAEEDEPSIRDAFEQSGIAYLHTEAYSSPMARLRSVRTELGVRTLLNTVEKFLNLAGATYAVTGVFHTAAMEKGVQLIQRMGYRRALVVQGVDGSEDVPVNRPSTICVIQGDHVEKRIIDPKEYGLFVEQENVHLSEEEQASFTIDILQGKPHGFRNMVLLNSGLRLWLTEKADTVERGIQMAQKILDSGNAFQLFNHWKALASHAT